MSRSFPLLPAAALCWLAVLASTPRAQVAPAQTPGHRGVAFQTSDNCLACHNGLTAPSGEDVSIGTAWRASMMANSSRDPYWQASVRREILDHPSARAEIEDECSICHMPMARTAAVDAGRTGEIFRLLNAGTRPEEEHRLAADGVSCTLCHQIGPERLGTRESFVGGFVIQAGVPRMLGPFDIDKGRTTIMRSSTTAEPVKAEHIRQSELCATCHTLYTQALGPDGTHIGSLPEQVPYLEWRHSAYASRAPAATSETPSPCRH